MLENTPRLYTYTMETDSGLAPNPFWGKLTMSACKKKIRKGCKTGDWIAGFAGRNIEKKTAHNGKKLVFLMQVKEKIAMSKYFEHPDFENKIPDLDSSNPFCRIGDNIFVFKMFESPKVLPHHYCKNEDKSKEIEGVYVLVACIFYYFGRNRLEIKDPGAQVKVIGQGYPNPDKQNPETVRKFLDYVKKGHEEMMRTISEADFSQEHNVPLPDYWYNGVGTDGRSKNGNFQG